VTSHARRPWWKKKRWAAALALWLVLPAAYLAGPGPAAYLVGRGWVAASTHQEFFTPAYVVLFWAGVAPQVWDSETAWHHRGERHAGRAAPPIRNLRAAIEHGHAASGSAPRLDATTIETFRDSLEAVEAALPEQEQVNFRSDLFTMGECAETYAVAVALEARRPPGPLDAARYFHGITAAELHAAAVRLRAARSAAAASVKASD
jgi:hypothetical protein